MSIEPNLKLLKSLSEESRYKIVELLLKEEKCACEIPRLIGKTQSNTSMHLAKLNECGILQSRREGKKIIYSIKDFRVYNIFKSLSHPKKK
jgi:ArsR family transcriptional regulator